MEAARSVVRVADEPCTELVQRAARADELRVAEARHVPDSLAV